MLPFGAVALAGGGGRLTSHIWHFVYWETVGANGDRAFPSALHPLPRVIVVIIWSLDQGVSIGSVVGRLSIDAKTSDCPNVRSTRSDGTLIVVGFASICKCSLRQCSRIVSICKCSLRQCSRIVSICKCSLIDFHRHVLGIVLAMVLATSLLCHPLHRLLAITDVDQTLLR